MATKKEKKYVAAAPETEEAVTRTGKVKEAKPVGNPKPLRIVAFLLWILALAFEVCALFVFLGRLDLKFMPQLYQLVAFLVLDLIAVIIGAQFWKKANHIDPVSEENKVKFCVIQYLQNWNRVLDNILNREKVVLISTSRKTRTFRPPFISGNQSFHFFRNDSKAIINECNLFCPM